jgi:hypothetical protein
MVKRSYEYEVILVNLSEERIFETEVLEGSNKYNYGGGILGPAGYSGNSGPMATPPNDVFIVRWKNSNGQRHEEKFDLRSRVKSSFSGEIVFVFGPERKFAVEVVDPPARYPIPRQR